MYGISKAALEGVDAVVHLAGVGIGDKKWSPARKELILSSRTQGTSLLASTLAAELAATSVIVKAVCPVLTATHPGAEGMGARPVAQSAAGLVWAATLPGAGRAVGSSAMDSLWTAAAREALKHRHGASIRWPHHESIA